MSLYENLGGAPAVDKFYRRVLADDRISRFFENVDMDKQGRQAEGIPDDGLWRTE